MYYVYFGYISPDNYDYVETPCYSLKEFNNEDDIIKFKEEFDEELHEECDNIIFRVFEGKELKLKPIEKIIKYKLV